MRRVKYAIVLVLLALAACGYDTEKVEPLAWPFLETTSSLTINGQGFDAFVASTAAHRKRAQHGLAIGEKQAIAYLYPKLDEPVEFKFNSLPDPAELVFVDESGKAIAVETVPAFSQTNMQRAFVHKGARVVLQLAKGATARLNISRGSAVTTQPDLVQKSAEAEAEFARLYFLRTQREDEKPEEAPFVSLKVLSKAEECARALKDRPELKEGQGVVMPVGPNHEFWLKGVEGKVCAAYLERSQGGGMVLASMFEGIEDTGATDLERPVYYSTGSPNYLAIWKGADTFTKHKVEKRARVVLAGVEVYSPEEPKYDALEIKFGTAVFEARLARTQTQREAAIAESAALKPGKGVVLAWDDPADVQITGAPTGGVFWYLNATGNSYSVGEKFAGGGDSKVTAKSRFVLVVPPGFEPRGDLDLPWVVRDLRPYLAPIAFYNVKQKDVVRDRWPTAKENLRKVVRVELAVTEAEQRQGLMFRTSLKKDHGMLFIYKKEEDNLSYWMKNCKMNLSIAFVNERGEIIKIHQKMLAPEPGTPDHRLPSYESDGPARYAIEMEESWFEKNGVKEGDRVFIPPRLTSLK
ncbi:MAG: DUF192 domain-containing protein [Planctomycetes bacterium]|jgi:uncharacterized membrane protein (UPF0127 family)|nr:DUF192 domain-containing protein [Planctomycetota bacterium]MCL4729244.1 DUF192 domain-containing protein [Planctomycetota bacterium]